MKILHTADWHIGKILHKQELYEDISAFFDWLERYILDQKVDVLLISGDIFDLANPSNRDTKLYYNFLHRLSQTGAKTIITGGNHDSVSLLNAPSSLLHELNISVVGGVPDDFAQQLVPLYDKDGKLICVVLAVPFLRDRDLRLSVSADIMVDKSLIIPNAIKLHYDRLVEMARKAYGPVPLVAMGHLFMQGSLTSDSEREIHVGNLQGIDSRLINPEISYMALGHIHKPQRMDKQDHIRYSGSPIYLDFSEAGYEKLVIQIEINDHNIDILPIKIPKNRNLLRLKGSISEVKTALIQYHHELDLPAWVEIEVLEDVFSPSTIREIQELESEVNPKYKIIKSRLTNLQSQSDVALNSSMGETIENLSPSQIFEIRLSTENLDEPTKENIKIAYHHVIESLHD